MKKTALLFVLLQVFVASAVWASKPLPSFLIDSYRIDTVDTVIIVDTVQSMPNVPKAKPMINPMSAMMTLMPEICLSFGLDEKKMDESIREMMKAGNKTIAKLKAFAKKHPSNATEQDVKRLMASLNLKIGGSKFDSRPLDPELVQKCTASNIQQLIVSIESMQTVYKKALEQKSMNDKFSVFAQIFGMLGANKDVVLINAFSKSYAAWVLELTMANKPKSLFSIDSVSIKRDTLYKSVSSIQKEQDKRNKAIFDSAYTLKPEQVKISDLPYTGGNDCKLVRIVRGSSNCLVTVAVPIHFQSNWFSTDSTFCIVDKQTNECYVPKRMENNIPLSKVIIVKDCAKKMIEVTYVFPPLKKSVQVVDLIDAISSPLQIPSNSGGSTEFLNVWVDGYSKKLPARTYIR